MSTDTTRRTHRLGIRDVLALNWPDHVRNRRGGIGNHALVLGVLADHADGYGLSFPKMTTLADTLGVSRDCIARIIDDLTEWKLLDRIRLRRNGNYAGYLYRVPGFEPLPDTDHVRTPNGFTLAADVPDSWINQSASAPHGQSVPVPTDQSVPAPGQEAFTGKPSQGRSSNPSSSPKVKTADGQPDDDVKAQFEEFWKHYPRRTQRGSKQKARAAFAKLTIEQRRAAYRCVAIMDTENITLSRSNPHAVTYLNQARWEEYEERDDGETVQAPGELWNAGGRGVFVG